MTAGGDCDNGANSVLPAVPAVHPGGHALDSGLLTEMRGANAGRGTLSWYDRVNRTEEITTLRRKGLAIAADATFNAPAGELRTVCTSCGLSGTAQQHYCPPVTVDQIATQDPSDLTGATYILNNSFTILQCQTLTIPAGITLTIPTGLQMTNNGTLMVKGAFGCSDSTTEGTIINNGYINIAAIGGTSDGQLWISNSSQLINRGTIDVVGNITSNGIGMNGILYNSGGTINLYGFIIGGSSQSATIYNYGGAVINGGNNILGYSTYAFPNIYTGDPTTCGAGIINGAFNATNTAPICPSAPYP